MKGMFLLMNKFIKNTTAILMAGIMGVASLGTVASANEIVTADSFSVSYLATVSKPTYSVKGTKGYRYIKLSTKTSGASIYYTTDGSTPSKTNGKKYSGGLIKITKNTKIKAIAIKGTTKSSVMTKTFYVTTKAGDVTGDGSIKESDYTRLKSYLDGKTTYICKDNADTSGNGGVSNKDLTLLRQYLDEEISVFPANKTNVTAPSMTLYKALGGKSFALTAPKGTIYYTTDGSTPTISNGKKYNGTKVLLEKSTTVKYVAYYNKTYSSVKSKYIEVYPCSEIVTKTDPNKEYDDSVTVFLSCGTSNATIYYTTNGSDPRTSSSYRVYTSEGIKLTENTTLKVYARCKGYADSGVSTFDYKVKSSGFSISGYVWEDKSGDGKKDSNESWIKDIKVSLIDGSNSSVMATATTDSNGYYCFSKIKKDRYYRIMFTYNGQKYRAYNYVVTGGNQAVEGGVADSLVISYSGAVSGQKNISSSNSYDKAITDKSYDTVATTSSAYASDTQNVNLALTSENYGSMKLTFDVEGNNTSASAGATVNYILTVANTGSKDMNSAVVRVYLDTDCVIAGVYENNTISVNYGNPGQTTGFYYYDIPVSAVPANSSVRYYIRTMIKSDITKETDVIHYAEVTSYSYKGSCYDKNIIPGTMTLGRVSQLSEAVTSTVKVGKPAVTEKLDLLTTSMTVDSGKLTQVNAIVTDAAKFDSSIVTVKSSNDNVAKAYVGSVSKMNGGAMVSIDVYSGLVTVDTPATITVALASDPTKSATISIIVKAPAAV